MRALFAHLDRPQIQLTSPPVARHTLSPDSFPRHLGVCLQVSKKAVHFDAYTLNRGRRYVAGGWWSFCLSGMRSTEGLEAGIGGAARLGRIVHRSNVPYPRPRATKRQACVEDVAGKTAPVGLAECSTTPSRVLHWCGPFHRNRREKPAAASARQADGNRGNAP